MMVLLFLLSTDSSSILPPEGGGPEHFLRDAAPFSAMAKNQELPTLLGQFFGHYGYAAIVSESVTGRVNGHFETIAPRRLLDQLAQAYRFVWYVDGNSVYVNHYHELGTEMVALKHISTDRLLTTLRATQILDHRFAARSLPEENLVFFGGPPRYLQLVTQTGRALDLNAGQELEIAGAKQVIEVFPLQHAWAQDMVFQVINREVVVPGVASVLRNILQGRPNQNLAKPPVLGRVIWFTARRARQGISQ